MKRIFLAFLIISVFASCYNTDDQNQLEKEYNPEKERMKMIVTHLTKIYASAQEELDIINQDTMILHRYPDKLILYTQFSEKLQQILRIYIENDLKHKDTLIEKAHRFNDKEINRLVEEMNKATELYLSVEEMFQNHK